MLRALLLTTALAALAAPAIVAQSRDRQFGRSSADWCDNGSDRDRPTHCEVREATLGGANPIDIDASPNGGIRVRGWDRGDVLVRSRVSAQADTDAEARAMVSAIRIETSGGSVKVVGPERRDDRHGGWSVSFEVQVPRNAVLTLSTRNGGIAIDDFGGSAKFQTTNGGISLSNVGGDIRGETTNGGIAIDDFGGSAKFQTTNGGISLTNVGGDIRGETTNGGVSVDLTGDHWDGQGLDLRTRNGAIRMTMPDHYSAALETGTTHGRINVDFPVTAQGRIGRELTTTLGAGGARIRAVTTNGAVTIRRR